MANSTAGLTASWSDIWLLDGVRTPFADYNGALAGVSPTDLGIKAAREVFAHCRCCASGRRRRHHRLDGAGELRHLTACRAIIGLYADVPIEIPAHMVQRVCGNRHRSADAGG